MALSGKTTNFELKYPAVSDSIVMGPGVDNNDFKEMMESVDAAFQTSGITDLGLIPGNLQQDEGAILLDVTGQGIYKYRVASASEEEQEYLINAYNMWVDATTQFRFTSGCMYIRVLDPLINNGVSVPWKQFATKDLIGTLRDLTTTAKTDLVSAINEVKDSIPAAVEGNTIITKYHITADPLTDSSQLYTYFSNDGIYFFTFEGNTSTSGYLFTHNDEEDLITYQTMIYKDGIYTRSFSSGSFNDEFWISLYGGKKYSSIVIGNSASGVTANDVDYLYTSGQDFKTILEQAVNSLPSTGGEIKILSGTYNISSAIALSRPVRLYGENGTIFSMDNVDASISSSKELKLYNLEVDFSSNIVSVNAFALLVFNSNTADNSICNCTFKTLGVSPKESSLIHAVGRINISNNAFYSLNMLSTAPISVSSGSFPAIISNNIFSFSRAPDFIVDTTGSMINPYIVNNYFDVIIPSSWYTMRSIPTVSMNMFKNGIDKLVFANGESIGEG